MLSPRLSYKIRCNGIYSLAYYFHFQAFSKDITAGLEERSTKRVDLHQQHCQEAAQKLSSMVSEGNTADTSSTMFI